jgi:uncharacterized membrane protein
MPTGGNTRQVTKRTRIYMTVTYAFVQNRLLKFIMQKSRFVTWVLRQILIEAYATTICGARGSVVVEEGHGVRNAMR